MRKFTLIWLGQLISLIGTWMSVFALDVWVVQETESASKFALVTLTNTIPLLVISPLAGTLIDRWNRRWTLIVSYLCVGLCTFSLIALISTGKLELWHIYVINTFIATFGAFQEPAYKAFITTLVPPEKLPRATSMVQLALGIKQIVSPLLAGILLTWIQLQGILLIDLVTVLAALVPLLFLPFNTEKINQSDHQETNLSSILQETIYGWTYIQERPALSICLLLYGIYQFLVGFVLILAYPLILSLTTPEHLGEMLFFGGLGTIVGSIAIGKLKTNWDNLVNSLLTSMFLSGVWIIFASISPSLIQITIATLLFFITSPILNGSIQLMVQTKVAEQVQGRVFALTAAISGVSLPIAAIIAGPLADFVFEPLMAFDGIWAKNLVGQTIGSGPGRGIGLLLIISGFFVLLVALFAYLYSPLRQLGDTTPDDDLSPAKVTLIEQ